MKEKRKGTKRKSGLPLEQLWELCVSTDAKKRKIRTDYFGKPHTNFHTVCMSTNLQFTIKANKPC
jgi:hypothetical protein